jgi:hypothetical protein
MKQFRNLKIAVAKERGGEMPFGDVRENWMEKKEQRAT